MKFIRQDKETGQQESVTFDEIKYLIDGYYKDTKLALESMVERGAKLQTNFSVFYKDNQ